jgi:transposase InsO family protein
VQLPKAPWLKGAVDIVGPIDNKYLVTYIDYYSSFPEVAITRDITSKSIVKILMNIFARHGYPEEIVSDNGPQFISQEFRRFLSSKGIKHVRSSPYFPRSNGKIERFHRYLKNNFQAVTLEGRSWEEELPKILMLYRSIPHPMTGKTPASLLFHREICTELPSIKLNVDVSSSNVEGDA